LLTIANSSKIVLRFRTHEVKTCLRPHSWPKCRPMKHTPALFLGAAPVAIIVALAAWIPARSEPSHLPVAPVPSATNIPSAAPSSETEVSIPPALVSPEEIEPEGTSALATYVLEAMQEWNKGPMAGKATLLVEIARDIAWVALERPRIWDGSSGAREAIVLARIAWFEDRYRDYVDQGYCQIWATMCMARGMGCNLDVLKRAVAKKHEPILSVNEARKKGNEAVDLMNLGTCDGGQAVSIWQIHYECGAIRLFADGGWQNACSAPRDKVVREISKADGLVTPNMSDEDRQKHRRNSARVAHAMARQSIRAGAGLRNYVGGEGPERAEMASMRLDSAMMWSAKHPYKP